MRYASIALAIVMVVVGALIISEAWGFRTSRTLGAPGPGRLPIIYAALLIVVSLGIVVSSIVVHPKIGLSLQGTPRALALAAGTAVCIYLWSMVGFLMLFVPATLIAARLTGSGWSGSLACAAILPLSVYGLFGLLLNIPFP